MQLYKSIDQLQLKVHSGDPNAVNAEYQTPSMYWIAFENRKSLLPIIEWRFTIQNGPV
jgi:hypothetical protein